MHCKFSKWINFKNEDKSIQTHKKPVWMGWNNTLAGLTTRMHSYWWLMQASDCLCFMCVSNITQKDVMMTELAHPAICPRLRTNSQTHTNISFISKRKPQGSLIYFWLITVRSLNEAPSCVDVCVRTDLDTLPLHCLCRRVRLTVGYDAFGLVLTAATILGNWPHHIGLARLLLTVKKLFC